MLGGGVIDGGTFGVVLQPKNGSKKLNNGVRASFFFGSTLNHRIRVLLDLIKSRMWVFGEIS